MKKIACCAVAALVFTLSFTACDEFFSNSFGNQRKYDVSKINVNAGNIDKWIDLAVGNPELADALVEKIIQELAKDNLGDADKAKLLEGGVNLAVESSGLGESILSNAAGALGDLTDADDDKLEDILTDILENIWEDFNSGGGPKAADNIAEIASYALANDEGVVEFEQWYKDTAKPGDVAEAIMVLILGELNDKDISIDNWSNLLEEGLHFGLTPDGNHVTVDAGASEKEKVLAAYLNLIVDGGPQFDSNPITSAIRDAFFNK